MTEPTTPTTPSEKNVLVNSKTTEEKVIIRNPQSPIKKLIFDFVKSKIPNRISIPKTPVTPVTPISSITPATGYDFVYWPPPIAIISITIIQIILFFIDAIKFDTIHGKGPMAKVLVYNPHKRYQVWRILTYMLVHVDYFHLVINLSLQIILGTSLEMMKTSWRVLIIYFSGIVAGSLAKSIIDPYVYLAGSSGGIYSLITAHLVYVLMNWSNKIRSYIHLIIALTILFTDFGFSIISNKQSKISFEAHIAGALAGILVGIFVLQDLKGKRCMKILWWISLFIYSALMICAIAVNIFYPSHFQTQY